MKRNIIQLAFMCVFAMLITDCGKTYMEENQDNYKATDVIPLVLKAEGPSLVLQTKSYQFKVTYDRAGSTWNWSAVDATVKSVSSDTKTATVQFNVLPAKDTALVKVTETTAGGVTSPEKVFKVKVKPFCPLKNGMNDLVGSWSGTDAYYYESTITTTVNNSTSLKMNNISVPFIEDWWAETVVEGGNCIVNINDDGTVTIARQHIYTTEYKAKQYRYDIKGSGTWDNCGSSPTMVIKYDIYYEGDPKGIAETYSSYLDGHTYLLAEITLNKTKSGNKTFVINRVNSVLRKPEKR
ncbi:MAG TPA: hypothetical protein PLX87_12145 [Bacteroidales bacterium]|nr:hypothetical protein [Bacteroidales bacterium]HOM41328.1 hypothetical protein [Bacteroidales bacterium]